jgi:hypothetical protein
MGCEEEISIVSNGIEPCITNVKTHYCILKSGHIGDHKWSK